LILYSEPDYFDRWDEGYSLPWLWLAVPATIVVAASEKLGPGRGQEGDHTVDLVWRKGILVIFPISLDRKIEIHRRA